VDKLTIVMNNYIDAECDANTSPRQAYERGFRRAYKKCETAMRSRKIEKKKASIENDQLKAENARLRKLVEGLWFSAQYLGLNPEGATGSGFAHQMRELGIEMD